MAASSASNSGGSSSSSSRPGLINSPASDWELQLAQMLQQVGNQQAQWAAQEYARAGAVTDAQISNYIATAQQGSNLAGNAIGRYNNLYGPQQDQYANEAGSYASNGRIQHEMGRAESGVMQAGDQAKNKSEQELQAFGVDPSSGRYQDLIRASNTADAAAAVGAGEQARRTTEMEGTRRREAAIAMGQQLPGAAVNALNSTYQGIAGAENSALGLANTGVNLTTSPSKFYDPAMNLKYPPVGQTSQSRSQQGSQSGSVGGGGSGGGKSSDPFNMDAYGRGVGGGGNISSSHGNVPAYSAPGGASTGYPGEFEQPQQDQGVLPAGNDGLAGSSPDPWNDPSAQDPYSWGGQGGDGIQPSNDQSLGGNDPWGGTPAAPSDWGGTDQSYGGSTPDANWGDYAGGGAIPSSMSPSGGQQVDDVPAQIPQTGGRAQLNVDEFVIPRDVAMWKGQEFFQKMIAQSRKARMGAPAKPSQGRQ